MGSTVGDVGKCPTCGKRRYATKRLAKKVAREVHPDRHLNAYRCGDYWHIGHLSPKVLSGELKRSELRIRRKR